MPKGKITFPGCSQKGIQSVLSSGPLAGFPMLGVKARFDRRRLTTTLDSECSRLRKSLSRGGIP